MSDLVTDIDTLTAAALAWIDGDPDPSTRAELQALVDAADADQLLDRVGAQLAFGTAGLRGTVAAGPNRMNRAVVLRATRGLADHLLASVPDAATRGVVVGFDARRDSRRFAEDVCGVLAAAGIEVRWFPQPQPTPLVAFAQRVLDAAAAVVVTASHNPPADNGYKVYVEGAAQIVPPTDEAIAAAIVAAPPAREVPRDDPHTSPRVHAVDAEVVERYLQALVQARPKVEGPDLRIAYTPLHGVGAALIVRALADGGYHDVHVVASQAEPDGEFPTVAFPNPEEPGAMDAVLALAVEVGADLVVANDPDADRLAVAVPDGTGRFRPLTGNQIGILLADHVLAGTTVARPLVASSIVSTPMIADVAAAHGARSEVTLTGFKWISAAARALEADGLELVVGFEEALGSTVGTVVSDKDGIGAAVAFADLARHLAAQGRTVLQRLDELAVDHGLWVSHQLSVTRPGAAGQAEIAAAMASLAGDGVPADLAGHPVLVSTDFRVDVERRPPWLGHHDLVAMELADGRAMIRPSGTEPKCKIYVDLRAEVTADDDLVARTAALTAEATAVAAALAAHVGFT